MRLRQGASPLLILLLPALTLASSSLDTKSSRDSYLSSSDYDEYDSSKSSSVGTKIAPVDGKDGMPHDGPFVTTEKQRQMQQTDDTDYSTSKSSSSYSTKDKSGPIMMNGEEIPESNDGVMDDRNRVPPRFGTTGTEGGVSQKDKDRKAKEGLTGERVENIPETPKEVPHSSSYYSDQDKVDSADKEEWSSSGSGSSTGSSSGSSSKSDTYQTVNQAIGLEKPADLPGKLRDNPNPVPDSANKDHLDFSSSKSSSSSSSSSTYHHVPESDDEAEGIIQPFHSFVLSLTMILFSEVGDKTFLVAALMAMKHDRMVVFSAAFGALLVMTVLSAVLGHTVPALIPKRVTAFLASGLFFVFGAKLLREGMAMDPNEGVTSEMQEVEMELQEKEQEALKHGGNRSGSAYDLEGGLNRKSRSQSRFPSPPRSPSTSPPRSPSPGVGFVGGIGNGLSNLFSLLLSPAWVQTFVMTFLGEWGDRSQIATIAMAAGQDYWWVTLGALVGHAICTGGAVLGGRAIAGKVSLKVVTVGGAVAFLVFGFIYLIEAIYA